MADKQAAEMTPEQKQAEKLEKFERLASKRMEKALAAIASLRGLSNKSLYHYTDAHVAQIGKAFEGEVTKTVEALAGKKAAASGFAFQSEKTEQPAN